MALYDDLHFLLSHLHHSFVTCDDTGMCEAAMLSEVCSNTLENDAVRVVRRSDIADYSELADGGHSYDLTSGFLMSGHRHRSNTAQRLERLRKEKKAQAKIAHVQWRDPQRSATEQELSKLFPRKDLSSVKEVPRKSALSEAIELFPAVVNNPFNEFARFDGRINRNAASKKILIYLTMLPPEERSYGMEVICLSNARVQELVGLICWMYTCEAKQPKLIPPVSNYCLKIAEETGEVDEDFPSLDGNEFVGKFGFPCLALIQRASEIPSSLVPMYINDDLTNIEVPNLDVSLREGSDLGSHKGSVTESRDPIQKDFGREEYDSHMRAVEAPLYRSYNVSFCQKMGMNYDVQLGISGEKVEINPLPPKGAAKLLSRPQKPTTHDMGSIAACEIISKKYSPGRCIFKLIHYTGTEFKKYVFETDPQTALDIVRKVQIILEMHSSHACKEYQAYRAKKLQRKVQKSHSKQ